MELGAKSNRGREGRLLEISSRLIPKAMIRSPGGYGSCLHYVNMMASDRIGLRQREDEHDGENGICRRRRRRG